MKNLKKSSIILIFIGFLISCSSKSIELFDAISIRLPATLTHDGSMENSFIDMTNGTTLRFTMTKNMSFGELLPKIDFDFLYNPTIMDSTEVIKNKETREISGQKIGIIEKTAGSIEIKTFFTAVNNEILMGELKGDTRNADYLDTMFDEILNSIEKK